MVPASALEQIFILAMGTINAVIWTIGAVGRVPFQHFFTILSYHPLNSSLESEFLYKFHVDAIPLKVNREGFQAIVVIVWLELKR